MDRLQSFSTAGAFMSKPHCSESPSWNACHAFSCHPFEQNVPGTTERLLEPGSDFNGRARGAAFDALQIGPVDLRPLAELLLGQTQTRPQAGDVPTEDCSWRHAFKDCPPAETESAAYLRPFLLLAGVGSFSLLP